MGKRTILWVIAAGLLGAMMLCSCGFGIAALTYAPRLMKRVGVAERFSTELELQKRGSVVIANPSGDVVLRTGDVSGAQVEAIKIAHSITEASARRALARIDIRANSDQGQASINVLRPRWPWAQNTRVNLVVTAPRDTDLHVLSQDGNIRVLLSRDASFVVDAQTEKGRVQCSLALSAQQSGFTGLGEKGHWLRGSAGSRERARLLLRAQVGNITIEALD